LLSLLPGALLVLTLLGIGLRHGAPAWQACVGAVLLTVLPVLGLGSLARNHGLVLLAAMWVWPALALLAMPTWFPGERAAGMSEGCAWLAMPLGEDWTGRAGRLGLRMGELLGEEKPLVVATPIEPIQTPAPGTEDTPASEPEPGIVVLPYEGDGSSMRVQVSIDGPDDSHQIQLLFDTGATFTTLDRGTLLGFGVTIPEDAPRARFQTANGPMESPMVLLDRIWLGEHAIDGVTVAVCDDCSQGESAGLLGLNVTKQFDVSMDHELQEIVLEPADVVDRLLDVTHWLDLGGEVSTWATGRVELELTGQNRAPRKIRQVVIEVECTSTSFSVELDDIPALGSASTRLELPRGVKCGSSRLVPRTAAWAALPTR